MRTAQLAWRLRGGSPPPAAQSVHFSTGDQLARASGNPAGSNDWQMCGWWRVNSYATPFNQVFAWQSGDGSWVLASDTEETAAGAIDIYRVAFGFTPQAMVTGSYTGWLWLTISHKTGDDFVTIRLRKDADGALTTTTFTMLNGVLALLTLFRIVPDTGDPVDVDVAQILFYERELDDTETLAQSYAGRTIIDDTDLIGNPDLSSAATAADDLSPAGNDFTITGTLSDTASVPASW